MALPLIRAAATTAIERLHPLAAPDASIRPGLCSERLVELRQFPAGGAVRQWIAFPPTDDDPSGLSRHTRRGILLEFETGAVWFFSTPLRYRWQATNLESVSRVCSAFAKTPRLGIDPIIFHLGEILDTTFEAALPTFDDDVSTIWKPRAYAVDFATARSLSIPGDTRALDDRRPTDLLAGVEFEARNQLVEAVSAFLARLDPIVLAHACSAGRFSASRYNSLVGLDAVTRRNRLQFIQTFPALAESLIGESVAPGFSEKMLPAVDHGTPTIDLLAKHFGARKHTIRYLVGKSEVIFGARWTRVPEKLLRLLDSIPPEHRPTDIAGWRRLDAFLDSAGAYFLRPEAHASLRLLLRDGRRFSKDGPVADESSLAAFRQEASLISEFCASLADCLRTRAQTTHRHGPPSTIDRPSCLADQALARRSWATAVALARAWRANLIKCRDDSLEAGERLRGRRFAALLPEPMAFGDRIIVPLVTAEELHLEGQTLKHCVGSYVGSCLRGCSYIVGVRRAGEKLSESTAEFALLMDRPGPVRVVLTQHRAFRDANPAQACRLAVAELLAAAGQPSLQAHFRRLVAERSERARMTTRMVGQVARILPVEEAFRRTLRPASAYDDLVQALLEPLARVAGQGNRSARDPEADTSNKGRP